MVHRDVRELAATDQAAVDARDRSLAGHQALQRVPTEDEHDFRLHERQLLFEVRRARLHLVGHRIAVHRRPALEHVGDVDIGAAQRDAGQKRVQQLAGGADKRLALPVFVEARGLADDHHVGGARSDSRYSLGSRRVQAAVLARPDGVVELPQGAGGNHRREIRRSRWPRFGRSDEQRSERIVDS